MGIFFASAFAIVAQLLFLLSLFPHWHELNIRGEALSIFHSTFWASYSLFITGLFWHSQTELNAAAIIKWLAWWVTQTWNQTRQHTVCYLNRYRSRGKLFNLYEMLFFWNQINELSRKTYLFNIKNFHWFAYCNWSVWSNLKI